MMPLDLVTARCFPTLASYWRRTRRERLLCRHSFAFLVGVAVTFLFLGYHQHVATENQGRLIGRIAVIEEQYQRDHPAAMKLTKIQAQDLAWAKAQKKRP